MQLMLHFYWTEPSRVSSHHWSWSFVHLHLLWTKPCARGAESNTVTDSESWRSQSWGQANTDWKTSDNFMISGNLSNFPACRCLFGAFWITPAGRIFQENIWKYVGVWAAVRLTRVVVSISHIECRIVITAVTEIVQEELFYPKYQ